MNKKGILFLFGMEHPGLDFLFGVLIGALVMYFLLAKGIVPSNLI